MRVKEVMTTSPSAVQADASASEAARIMWERDCGAVPVIDQLGCVTGIVTDRDICMAAYFEGQPLTRIPVQSVMSRAVCAVRPDDNLANAERLMQEHQIRRLPVVGDGGTLVGMLSLSDVSRGVSLNGGSTQKPDGQELLQTLKAVSEPRASRDSSM